MNREKDWWKPSRRPIWFLKEQRHMRSYFVFAKHCTEKFYSKQKGIYCLCRLTESFWQCKLECNDEDTEDDKNRLQR